MPLGVSSATNLTFTEGIIFLTAKDTLHYIDHNKVLDKKPHLMKIPDAVAFCIEQKLLTRKRADQMAFLDIKKVITAFNKKNAAQGVVKKLTCNVTFELVSAVAAVNRDVLYVSDCQATTTTIYEVLTWLDGAQLKGRTLRKFTMEGPAIVTSLVYHDSMIYACSIGNTGGITSFNLNDFSSTKLASNNSEECREAHGITILTNGVILFTDSKARQVKSILPDGSIIVIAGIGQAGMSYGPADRSSFMQPTGIINDCNCAILIDIANSTIVLLTGTDGLVKYLRNIGTLYDIFSIHSDIHITVQNGSALLNEVIDYFNQTHTIVKDHYGIHGIVQGPQGSCSPQSLFALQTLQQLLNSWKETHSGMKIKAVSTKANENLFAQVRMEVATPDMLEFSRIFPAATEDLLMRISDLPFIYQTKATPFYQALGKEYLKCEIPKFPKPACKILSPEDKHLLDDYKKCYLEGVRQRNIRAQTTKDSVGTLPLYVYQKKHPRAEVVDFAEIFSVQLEVDRNVLYKAGDFILYTENDVPKIGCIRVDYYEGDRQDKIAITTFEKEEDNALALHPVLLIDIHQDRIKHKLDMTSNDNVLYITEEQYEVIFCPNHADVDDDVEEEEEEVICVSGE